MERHRRRRHSLRGRHRSDSQPKEASQCVPRGLESLSWLRRSERALLYHFVVEASRVVISSRHGQRQFCNMIISLALRSPPLLNATLAYSAAQRQSLLLSSATLAENQDASVSRYVCSSLSAAQVELLHPNSVGKVSLLAASLMLCLLGLSSGDSQGCSWRVHAQGAKALLASIRRSTTQRSSTEPEASIQFLSRWYLSIESLTALTPSSLVNGQCVVQDVALGTITEPELLDLNVCDDHFGYPTQIAMLFREIGASAWERRRQFALTTPQLSQRDFDIHAENLHANLDHIAADVLHPSEGLMFYPGIREELSDTDVSDFMACTQAYIHMARILIERRVRGAPPSSEPIQTSVQTIIKSIEEIAPVRGPSPAVAVGPPLFTAGCEALAPLDQQKVRQIFQRFCTESKSHNMEQAIAILEDLWASDGGMPDWLDYQEIKYRDFLPY